MNNPTTTKRDWEEKYTFVIAKDGIFVAEKVEPNRWYDISKPTSIVEFIKQIEDAAVQRTLKLVDERVIGDSQPFIYEGIEPKSEQYFNAFYEHKGKELLRRQAKKALQELKESNNG